MPEIPTILFCGYCKFYDTTNDSEGICINPSSDYYESAVDYYDEDICSYWTEDD